MRKETRGILDLKETTDAKDIQETLVYQDLLAHLGRQGHLEDRAAQETEALLDKWECLVHPASLVPRA